MALLGVILLLAGAGAGVVAYLATRGAAGPVTVTAFGLSRDASPVELVLYGAVAVLRASARISEVEESAETARLEHERRFEEAGLRDDDLRRRESELAARHEGLDTREAELARREAEWREREGPSRADVVTGRAEGSVADGTARWTDDQAGDHAGDQVGDRAGDSTVDPTVERGDRYDHDDRYDRDDRHAHRDTTA